MLFIIYAIKLFKDISFYIITMAKPSKSKTNTTATNNILLSSDYLLDDCEKEKIIKPKTKKVKDKDTKNENNMKIDETQDNTSVQTAVDNDTSMQVEYINNEVVHIENEVDILDKTGHNDFMKQLNEIADQITELKTKFKVVSKNMQKELKELIKIQSKKKRSNGNKQPSGFIKPTLISDELAKFLNVPSGTMMARTDVTREINKYIRDNNLKDESNGRKIIPDAKLNSLLRLKEHDELTFFNLQKYMSFHFKKDEK